jgi:hypothetical protein
MDPTPAVPLHPLATDSPVVASTLDALHKISPADDLLTDLTDLVLETSAAAQQVCAAYVAARPHTGWADLMLTQSILATVVLHHQGRTFSGNVEADDPLYIVATRPYGRNGVKDQLIAAYQLDKYEALAIDAYSNASKGDKVFHDQGRNPHYMGAETGNWGIDFANGWDALSSALRKLPCLRDLGLLLTTYRAPRAQKSIYDLVEMEKLRELKVDATIQHGIEIMGMGQRHFLSTAVTYNSHWDRADEVGGLIAITGYSGVYINPFGVNGWVDGAEILYPPRILTVFEGVQPRGYQRQPPADYPNPAVFNYPVVHLREIAAHEMEVGQPMYEDSKFVVLVAGDFSLDDKKLAMVRRLETDFDEPAVIEALRTLKLSHKGVMYLTIQDLTRVIGYLNTKF